MSTTAGASRAGRPINRAGLVAALALGAGVSVAVGVYAGVHTPAERPLFTLGFSGMLQMKAWLTTAAAVLLVVQLVTALGMWGRLPGARRSRAALALTHRYSGTAAFVLTLPVAVHCLWSLGFAATSPRVVVHGLAGSLFYGAFATKMLGLRLRRLPGWTLPVLGGTVLALLVLIWLTSALWFFTRPGVPRT
ncbi:DUF6529 family protein [Georgenia yuyongxinii]|uniref:DUF6529 family protein n=1 Tax=Georgenia yuyongxinii TaxID=2589797 RepID=UPI001E56C67B|nr:DUF6529 family protein [Georgenia yuyongxinii]